MSRGRVRMVGGAMYALAVLGFLAVHAVIAPAPAGAWACCQDCEAKEAACYASCNAGSHDLGGDDSSQACADKCDAELWNSAYGCWTHCAYCSTPPNPPNCYTVAFEHKTCDVWQTCTYTHELFYYQTYSGWCTQ